MILIDSSVWIDYFTGKATPETKYLHNLMGNQLLLVGDIILAEVLQGFRSDQDFELALQALSVFDQAQMLNSTLAVKSAQNYRFLRKKGITVRKTIDCLIATFCIETDTSILHCDHDFDPFEVNLGLQVIRPDNEGSIRKFFHDVQSQHRRSHHQHAQAALARLL